MKLYPISSMLERPSRNNAAPMILVCKIEIGSACKNGIRTSVNNPIKKKRISLPT
jgi:hypothetical protein